MKIPENVDRVLSVRRMLLDDAPLPVGLLNASIQRSWERTRANGVRPRDRHLFGHWVSAREARRVEQEHQALISLALPDMQHLWSSIRSPHWLVMLTNRQGTIVHTLGEPVSAPRELSPFRSGRRLVETELGTNAPIVVAEEAAPVVVLGHEHFLDELRGFDCAAVPIFGLDGKIAGILDVTGFHVEQDRRILERVIAAASSIENRAYETASSDFVVRLHEDPRYIGTPNQGIVLVREDGAILSANRAAQAMLALESAVPSSPVRLEDLFDLQGAAALRGLRRGPLPAHTRRGARLFADVASGTSRKSVAIHQRTSTLPSDARMEVAFSKAREVFDRGLPILLRGETGAGKERFARRLHDEMAGDEAFLLIDCSALADGISAGSDLFRAFDRARPSSRSITSHRSPSGRGCTLFLDEVGNLPMHGQTRLLRSLESHAAASDHSGSRCPDAIRVISATRRDLLPLVAAGKFREDLYFRLTALTLLIPPLRERSDREALVQSVLAEITEANGLPCSVSASAIEQLLKHPWPGNIRQLRSALEVASALAGPGNEITAEMLPLLETEPLPEHLSVPVDAPRTLQQIRLDSVRAVIAAQQNNISAAARVLGVSRTTLYKYLRDHEPSRVQRTRY